MNQKMIYEPQMGNIARRVNNPAKLVQCIQCHNEEEFIGLTLASIYDEVDRIIVIEGAVENRPNSTEDGHSTDKTVEIINDFKENHDKDNKVTFLSIRRPWKNLEEIKQMFLDMVNDGDWLIINDADEFYRPEDIRRLRVAIDRTPHACEFVPIFLHFYKDFKHVATPGPEWQPQHQRVFKYTQGMKYNVHPIAHDAAGQDTYFAPHYQGRRVMLNDFFIYHYGYARSNMDRIMVEKRQYYKKEIAKLGGADKKFDKKVDDWFADSEPLLLFDGNHPEIVENHPMFSASEVTKECPRWTDNELYEKVVFNKPYGNIWLCMTQQATPHMNMYHNGVTIERCQ